MERHNDTSRPIRPVEFGIDTFGDVTHDADGTPLAPGAGHPQRRRARPCSPTRSASTSSGVGEHHRDDFAISAPEIVLAADRRAAPIASSSAPPSPCSLATTRSACYERFATLDAISNGRAEIILGRGSFTESFPLFGFDLADYEELFEEKLDLFAALRRRAGRSPGRAPPAPPLNGQHVYPQTRARPAADLGRRRRQPRVGRARGALRLAADARDHRRRPRAASRPTSTSTTGRSPSSAARAAGRRALARPRRRNRRGGARAALAALQGECATASAPSAAGRP